MLSEPLVKLNSVYVKVQEALLHLRGDLLVGDTGVVGKAVGGTARIFDAPAFYAQQVRQILRKFGSDAHMFVPGPGVPVLGPELIVSGDGTSTAGWSVQNGATLTADGSLRVVGNGSTQWPGVYQQMASSANKTYLATFDLVSANTGLTVVLRQTNYATTAGQVATAIGQTPGKYQQTIVATGSSIAFGIEPTSGAANADFRMDNVSVREILGYTNYLNGFAAGNYLDSTGNTNASVDGAVGLVLDAAGSVGPELMPAGTAGAVIGAPGALPNGWQGSVTVNGITRQVVGIGSNYVDLRLTGTATSTWADYVGVIGTTISVTPGETYRIEMPETVVIAGSMPSGGGVTYGCAMQLSGAFVGQQMGRFQHVTIPAGVNQLRLFNTIANYANGAVVDVTLRVYSTVSAKKVTGTHASQATTANKPILRRGIVNLLTYSNDLTNAAWSANSGAAKVNATTFSLTNTYASYIANALYGVTIGNTYTAAIILSGTPGTQVYLGICDLGGAYPRTNQAITLSATPTLYTVTRPSVTQTGIDVRVTDRATSATITFGGAAIFQGTLTAQQILAAGGIPLTTTAPASSQYGAYAWQFDGSDDRLVLGSVPFQMTDDHWVVAAVGRCSNAASYPCIVAPTALVTSGIAAWLYVDASNMVGGKWSNDAGDAAYASAGYGVLDPTKPFVASLVKQGASAYARCNGVSGTPVTVPAGACTVSSGAIGGLVGAPLNGAIVGVMFGKGAITPAELRTIEKYLGSLAGVPIA